MTMTPEQEAAYEADKRECEWAIEVASAGRLVFLTCEARGERTMICLRSDEARQIGAALRLAAPPHGESGKVGFGRVTRFSRTLAWWREPDGKDLPAGAAGGERQQDRAEGRRV